jgi:hypothetical protein
MDDDTISVPNNILLEALDAKVDARRHQLNVPFLQGVVNNFLVLSDRRAKMCYARNKATALHCRPSDTISPDLLVFRP